MATQRRRSTKGTRSKTHPGRTNYTTKKGDKVFHRKGKTCVNPENLILSREEESPSLKPSNLVNRGTNCAIESHYVSKKQPDIYYIFLILL